MTETAALPTGQQRGDRCIVTIVDDSSQKCRRSLGRAFPHGIVREGIVMKRLVSQLDEVAGTVNAWLLVVAIGLSALDASVLVALRAPDVVEQLWVNSIEAPVQRLFVDYGWPSFGGPRAASR
jgi:hypothetical protein